MYIFFILVDGPSIAAATPLVSRNNNQVKSKCRIVSSDISADDITTGRFRRDINEKNGCVECEDPQTGVKYKKCSVGNDDFTGHAQVILFLRMISCFKHFIYLYFLIYIFSHIRLEALKDFGEKIEINRIIVFLSDRFMISIKNLKKFVSDLIKLLSLILVTLLMILKVKAVKKEKSLMNPLLKIVSNMSKVGDIYNNNN